jgi:hypothetical protein
VFAVLAAALAGGLPLHGTLVPGTSLGGLRLGDSPTHVVSTWGRRFGVCAGCTRPTWYYNYTAYQPQGAGVSFSGKHVVQLFTLWSPTGWRTAQGLRTGDPATRIRTLYGRLSFVRCNGYDAYELVRPRSVTSFYAVNGKVWGFGLSRPAVPLCL